MEETKGGLGLFGYIIAFVIIVWVISAITGGNGLGFGNRDNALGFEDYKAICENQKANITQTATTQYLIEKQANETRAVVNAQSNALANKIDYYEYMGLRDKLADEQRENMMLKTQLYNDAKFNGVQSQLAEIQCHMLKRPELFGCAVSCTPVVSPNFCGGCCGGAII